MSHHCRICNTCCAATSTLYCHADMAYLCVSCDTVVHSANMIAARHERIPVGPMSRFLSNIQTEISGQDEASSWLLDEPISSNGGPLLANYSQYTANQYHYLYNPNLSLGMGKNNNTENETSVPLKLEEISDQQHRQQQQQLENFYMEMEKSLPKDDFYHNPSSNQSAIVPFLDAEPAQDSTMSTFSQSYSIVPLDLYPTPTPVVGLVVSPTSREARVLRYREKKKARKFEKTIRYASRKAYAEARPRVKGRFAKKTKTEIEMNTVDSKVEYMDGIVPSLEAPYINER